MLESARRNALLLLLAVLIAVGSGLGISASAAENPDDPSSRTPPNDPDALVVVESAELVESSSLGSWFGGSPTPTLVLVLRNESSDAVVPLLDLFWRDGNALPNRLYTPDLEELPPGTRATVRVPVRFNGRAQGEHTVSGVVRAAGKESAVVASTSVGPWGLYGLLVVALLAGSALRTRWVMAQVGRDEEFDEVAESTIAQTLTLPQTQAYQSQVSQGEVSQTQASQGEVQDPPESVPDPAPVPVPVHASAPDVEPSVGPPRLHQPELEARALETIERFAAGRETELAVPHQRASVGGRRIAGRTAEDEGTVEARDSDRDPGGDDTSGDDTGGRRSHRASTRWLTRR